MPYLKTKTYTSPSAFEGILGHYHLTRGKVDPGPAFEWERLAAEMEEIQ